jgi:hypothetical protein
MGYSATRAYRMAYQVADDAKPQGVASDAWALAHNPDVALYVAQLRREAAEKAAITAADMLVEMGFNRTIALDEGKLSVAASSSRDRAKVAGLMTPQPRQNPADRRDEAADLVTGVVEEVRSLNDLGRRVFFTLELGKRRALAKPE